MGRTAPMLSMRIGSLGQRKPRHRLQEFLLFLKHLARRLLGAAAVSGEGQRRHQAEVREWLTKILVFMYSTPTSHHG